MKIILTVLLLVISNTVFSQEKEVIVTTPWDNVKSIESWQLAYAIYGSPGNGLGGLRGLATAVLPRTFKTELDCKTTAPGLQALAKSPGHEAKLTWVCVPIYKDVVMHKPNKTNQPRQN